jgi:cell wall-associated NlpC family hydrolase
MMTPAPPGWEGAARLPPAGAPPHAIARLLAELRVPFLHMGRTVRGCDCVGVLVLIARAWGLPVEDSPYYGREPARNNNAFQLADYLARNLGPPTGLPPAFGDVVLMRLRPRFAPAHVGMVVPHPNGLGLVHAYGEIGRTVYHRLDPVWALRIEAVYEWPAKPTP